LSTHRQSRDIETMKVTRSVLFVVIVVVASTAAAVAHLTDEIFDIPALRLHG
jgi:hypothetical protein